MEHSFDDFYWRAYCFGKCTFVALLMVVIQDQAVERPEVILLLPPVVLVIDQGPSCLGDGFVLIRYK